MSTMYVTTHKQKAPIDVLSHNKAPKTQQVEHYQHLKKQPVTFLPATSPYATLAPAKSLLI